MDPEDSKNGANNHLFTVFTVSTSTVATVRKYEHSTGTTLSQPPAATGR